MPQRLHWLHLPAGTIWSEFWQSGGGKDPVALISVLSRATCNVPGLFFSGLGAKEDVGI